MSPITIALLCGGRSAEHEISFLSARNILRAMDPAKYRCMVVAIDRQGQWVLSSPEQLLKDAEKPARFFPGRTAVGMLPGKNQKALLVSLANGKKLAELDVVFPALHGPFGEDGAIQGFLKTLNIPYVGAGVLGSAVGMDKEIMKKILRASGLPTARFLTLRPGMPEAELYQAVTKALGSPFFVKPAHQGSSVGIHKVAGRREFASALADAFQYAHKLVAEEFIQGRELECAVLGNEWPIASLAGEIVPRHAWYSYDAKYRDPQGARLEMPAKISPALSDKVQDLAVRAYAALACEGMARVDFFLRGKSELLVNEINTIPGFTAISMYPKLWELSGIPTQALVDHLVRLAQERFAAERKIKSARRKS